LDTLVRHRLVMRDLALALPAAVITLALAFVACAEILGAHPLTMGPPRSVPEAIVMRDAAGAARLIDEGADVRAIGLVRAGVLTDRPVLLTPLEAAVLVDATAMLDFLAASGATVPVELACLAADAGARTVRARLGEATCPSGEALRRVLARP
jgi:hypothetical protein